MPPVHCVSGGRCWPRRLLRHSWLLGQPWRARNHLSHCKSQVVYPTSLQPVLSFHSVSPPSSRLSHLRLSSFLLRFCFHCVLEPCSFARTRLQGSYCPGGGPVYACPAGSTTAGTASTSAAACSLALSGYYLPPGSSVYAQCPAVPIAIIFLPFLLPSFRD